MTHPVVIGSVFEPRKNLRGVEKLAESLCVPSKRFVSERPLLGFGYNDVVYCLCGLSKMRCAMGGKGSRKRSVISWSLARKSFFLSSN